MFKLHHFWVLLVLVTAGVSDRLNTKLQLICENCVVQPLFFAIKIEGIVECRPFPPLLKGEVFTHYVLHPLDCPLPYTPEIYTPDNITHVKRKRKRK